MINAYLASRSVEAAELAGLEETLARPPRTNQWVPETHFCALALLVREQHFSTDDTFLLWVKDLNARLFGGPIYRALMAVASTRMLIAGTGLRWRQFHQGTTLTAEHGSGNWVDFKLVYEPYLFQPLHVRLFMAAIEAAIEAAGVQRCRTAFVEAMPTEARARIEW